MTRATKPVTPDQRLRDLRRDLKAVEKEEPGPERAVRLAALAREAHDLRMLNQAMHTGALSLAEDPDAPDALVEAYLPSEGADPEDRLRAYGDLDDLARYLGRDDVRDLATERQHAEARAWVAAGDTAARRHRLRTLTSLISREFADSLRDEYESW